VEAYGSALALNPELLKKKFTAEYAESAENHIRSEIKYQKPK
jgi:hypothetical protein